MSRGRKEITTQIFSITYLDEMLAQLAPLDLPRDNTLFFGILMVPSEPLRQPLPMSTIFLF